VPARSSDSSARFALEPIRRLELGPAGHGFSATITFVAIPTSGASGP